MIPLLLIRQTTDAEPPPFIGQIPRASRYRSRSHTRMVYRLELWVLALLKGLL